MDLRFSCFWLPKAGHTVQEYEDAYAGPAKQGHTFRLAIADGATESAYAREWAMALTEAFVIGEEQWLEHARMRWQQKTKRETPERWYLTLKKQTGAYATFLGIEMSPQGTLKACAVGDSCLLHYRADRLIKSWPLEHAEAFSHQPVLLNSTDNSNVVWQHLELHGHTGDVFVLATDALAQWLLRIQSWPNWLVSREQFEHAIQQGRTTGRLRNDDVTCLIIECL